MYGEYNIGNACADIKGLTFERQYNINIQRTGLSSCRRPCILNKYDDCLHEGLVVHDSILYALSRPCLFLQRDPRPGIHLRHIGHQDQSQEGAEHRPGARLTVQRMVTEIGSNTVGQDEDQEVGSDDTDISVTEVLQL